MADTTLSGYKAAATSALTTELNSLANDGWCSLSSAIDNSSNLYVAVDIEVYLNTITPTGADAAIEVYIVPTVDGTNYPTYTESGTVDEQENNPYYVGSCIPSLDAEAHRMVLRNVSLPNDEWKIGIRNKTNVTLNATLNTVKWRPWQFTTA